MKSSNSSRLTLVPLLGGPLHSSLPTEVSEPDPFHTLNPCQLVGTRNPNGPSGRPILQHDMIRKFPVQGVGGLPVGVKADFVNLTAVRPTGAGHLTLYPSKITKPFVSSIDFAAGEMAVAEGTVVPSADQSTVPLDLSGYSAMLGTGTVHMVLNVNGYFQSEVPALTCLPVAGDLRQGGTE